MGRTHVHIEPSALTRAVPAVPAAVPEMRHAVVTYAQALGATPEDQRAIRLAVSEAVTNVVRHAYVGRDEVGALRVEAHRDGGSLLVVVTDDGIGPAPRADSPGSGFGLGLIAACTVERELGAGEDGRGSLIRMRFALGA